MLQVFALYMFQTLLEINITNWKVAKLFIDRNLRQHVIFKSTYEGAEKDFTISLEQLYMLQPAIETVGESTESQVPNERYSRCGWYLVSSRLYNNFWLLDIRRCDKSYGSVTTDGFAISRGGVKHLLMALVEIYRSSMNVLQLLESLTMEEQIAALSWKRLIWYNINRLHSPSCLMSVHDQVDSYFDEVASNINQADYPQVKTLFDIMKNKMKLQLLLPELEKAVMEFKSVKLHVVKKLMMNTPETGTLNEFNKIINNLPIGYDC